MFTLQFDTTRSMEVEVKLVENNKVLDQLQEKQSLGSQVLLPAIQKILKRNRKKLTDLTEIQVNPGPGSFTGTRVGVTVANALGFALNIPVNGKKGKIILPKYEKSKFDMR